MNYFIVFYLLSAVIPLIFLNYDVFVKKESLTYREYIVLTCLFVTPLVNFVMVLFIFSWFLSKSKLFDKISKLLDSNIN